MPNTNPYALPSHSLVPLFVLTFRVLYSGMQLLFTAGSASLSEFTALMLALWLPVLPISIVLLDVFFQLGVTATALMRGKQEDGHCFVRIRLTCLCLKQKLLPLTSCHGYASCRVPPNASLGLSFLVHLLPLMIFHNFLVISLLPPQNIRTQLPPPDGVLLVGTFSPLFRTRLAYKFPLMF